VPRASRCGTAAVRVSAFVRQSFGVSPPPRR